MARKKTFATEERARGKASPRLLFDCWRQVSRAVRSARHLALFLDFDGTLVPLCRWPSDVKPLNPALGKVLRRLAGHRDLNIYVISGRPLAEIQTLVPIRKVKLLGLHGWEGRDVPPLTEERKLLRIARLHLDKQLSKIPKVWVEDKRLALAVHYRGASPLAISRARAIVHEVLGPLGSQIHMVRGHKLWELLPRQISGKGSAVEALLSTLPKATLAIFVGDDVTDESAFKVIPRGLSIRVGRSPRTKARFLLQNPDEVKMFLLKLDVILA